MLASALMKVPPGTRRRRYLGYDVQYFAAVEPQRRLAPHVHLARRGTVSRA
jgi:hypothetical protein